MKAFIFTLFLLPLAATANDDMAEKLLGFLKFAAQGTVDSIQNLVVDPQPIVNSPRANLIYDSIFKIIREKLLKPDIPINYGNDTTQLQISGTLVGMDNATIDASYPASGYNLDNFTVHIPELTIEADQYEIRNLDLGIVKLNGQGGLNIAISEVNVYAKMTISYRILNGGYFEVKTIPAMSVTLGNATIALENLGGSGEAMSNMLNGIATKALPRVVKQLNYELRTAVETSGGNCKNDQLEFVCSIIGLALTALKKQILG